MKIARVVDSENKIIYAAEQADGRLLRVETDGPLQFGKTTQEEVAVSRWLPPIEPRTIICIGANYAGHIKELGHELPEYPVVFMKNPAAALGHLETIRIPQVCGDEVDYEGELAVVIGKKCCNTPKEQALDYVLGYTAANDVSARLWQLEKGGSQWCRGKGFDNFAPLGAFLVTTDEISDPNSLTIETRLNSETVQKDNTANMIFDIPTLISFLSQDTTLLPGTVILTGTPQGIGWARKPRRLLQKGDIVRIEIAGIGQLINPVE
ncbi:MAG: fumarylacetoacetate hydrolase family protein [Sedimentisphaerales bacterium]|nr:fumarylacetoacetate hydrolase family protein [Sedimentisphaerales bacterium]